MMTANERIVKALKTISEHRPDISLTGLISRQSSVDDIRFMSDEDLALVLEDVARVSILKILRNFDEKYADTVELEFLGLHADVDKYYEMTKENEQISYNRFKILKNSWRYMDLLEEVHYNEFMRRFFDSNEYWELHKDEFINKDIIVINHCTQFYQYFLDKHIKAYTIAIDGEDCVFFREYVQKLPDDYEVIQTLAFNSRKYDKERAGYYIEIDGKRYYEWLSLAFRCSELPRVVDYANKTCIGVFCQLRDKKIELLNQVQAVDMFHELFQKAKISKIEDHL
ncbi:hypothetical protein [Enterocloster bolteae]|jgi:hypothetical protein|nr:hypothetical protein [Enterocloster bolteae]